MRLLLAALTLGFVPLAAIAAETPLTGGCGDVVLAANLAVESPKVDGPRLVSKPALHLAGVAADVTPSADPFAIDELWARLEARDHWITKVQSNDGIGVCFGGGGDGLVHYFAGMETAPDPSVPEGFATVGVPAARYAVFTVTGPAIAAALARKAIPDLLAKAGLTALDAPEIERFDHYYRPASKTAVMEIWVPVAP